MRERIRRLKERDLGVRASICAERAEIATRSYRVSAGQPAVIRRALLFRDILREMSIFIDADELIVGNQAKRTYAAPIFPEFGIAFVLRELDSFSERPYDKFDVDEDTKAAIRDIAPFWSGQTHEDFVMSLTRSFLPAEIREFWDENSFCLNNVLFNSVRKASGEGHVNPNYDKFMEKGVAGVVAEAREALSLLDMRGDPHAFKKKMFLDSVIICYEAVAEWILRYHALATELLGAEADPVRAADLRLIAKNCAAIAGGAPATFHEALQLTYFLFLLIHIESSGHSNYLCRMDQYLYPFYRKDVAEGLLSDADALELIDCFYLKVGRLAKVRPWPETRLKGGAPMFLSLTLGGQNRRGEDASNPLTYLFLDALADTRLPNPTPQLRVFEGTPKKLLMHAAKTLMLHGGGLPAFFGDNVFIKALEEYGVPLEEARDYGINGCSEAVIPGKSAPHTGGDCYFNLLKILEIVLNEGVNTKTGKCLLPTRKLGEFTRIEEVVEEYRRNLRYYMGYIVPFTAITSYADDVLNPVPYGSALIDYRIAMGAPTSEGGGENARYTETIIQGHGIGDVANSLCVIDRLVFKEKVVSLAELAEACHSNWEGERGLDLWLRARAVPKYGNDIDEVDRFVALVADMFVSEGLPLTPWRGGKFGFSLQGLTANVPEGEVVGATPDGRHDGEALSDNASPHAGTDTRGPTSVLKSVAKIDHSRYVFGNILNLKFHPSTLQTAYGEFDTLRAEKFVSLIQAFLNDLDGNQVQFNIVTADTLRQAQLDPDKHRDLMVKVAGYSAYFFTLDKSLQDQIIKRTEHQV